MNRDICKTAKEKFEESLWKQIICDSEEIVYEYRHNKCFHFKIVFDLVCKKYSYTCHNDFNLVDMQTHKLITYQLEELGWLL